MPKKEVKSSKLKVKSLNKKASTRSVRSARSMVKESVDITSKKTPIDKPSKPSTLSAQVYGKDGKAVGRVSLPSEIFGAKINPKLMAQAVRVYLANQRSGTASTKTRGEVRGSTRKIYRQKGTGRARHGAIRAPIFVGGGIVFGPKMRDFSLKLSKNMKKKALFSALSQKFQEGTLKIVDKIDIEKAKTKSMVAVLTALHLIENKKRVQKILFVLPEKMNGIELSARNISGLKLDKAYQLSSYEVLDSDVIVMLKDAIAVLSHTFLKKSKAD